MEEVIARILQLFLALAGAYALALWFALVVWTYRDITSRSTNAVTHVFSTLVVVLFWVPGAIIYLILRPRETLDEAFQRAMEEEYLLQDLDDIPVCPSCRRSVREEFLFCPHCSAELRQPCGSCSELVDLRWDICPFCGAEQRAGSGGAVPMRANGSAAQRKPRKRSGPAGGNLQAIDGGKAATNRVATSGPRSGAHDADTAVYPLTFDDSGDPRGESQPGHEPAPRPVSGRAARDQG